MQHTLFAYIATKYKNKHSLLFISKEMMTTLKMLSSGTLNLGHPLSEQQLNLFELYYQILINWNQKLNLTAITNFEDVQVKHFLDSLTVATALPEMLVESRLLDVGTGAGFPGIPLKILFPELQIVLVESITKKINFLSYLVSRLGIKGIQIINERAETLGSNPLFREQFDIVASRALAPLSILSELTLPFCRLNGIVIAQKKGNISKEIMLARHAIELLGGKIEEIKKVALSGLEEHLLVVITKRAPTPAKYPRRPGIPSKYPIKHQDI